MHNLDFTALLFIADYRISQQRDLLRLVTHRGGSRGGVIAPPKKTTEVTLFTMIFYNSENSTRDIRPFSVHCFVTAVL